MKIFLTGASGFVGQNFISTFKNNWNIRSHARNSSLIIYEDVVVHLAGKAHDLRNIQNPNEYYDVNTALSIKVFDSFLNSSATVFITLSSVKAVADKVDGVLTEQFLPNPQTHYGKSKLLAEQYILSKEIPDGKRVFILRPCMIHGPGNKGNLNILYKFVSKGIPWPLGIFKNKRSYCSIDNLLFVLKELIERVDITSGVYNIADDEPLSTNDVISILAESQNRKPMILNVPKQIIQIIARIGNFSFMPLNEERLKKLTDSYVISNQKIKSAIGKPLPLRSKDGLLKTFKSFN